MIFQIFSCDCPINPPKLDFSATEFLTMWLGNDVLEKYNSLCLYLIEQYENEDISSNNIDTIIHLIPLEILVLYPVLLEYLVNLSSVNKLEEVLKVAKIYVKDSKRFENGEILFQALKGKLKDHIKYVLARAKFWGLKTTVFKYGKKKCYVKAIKRWESVLLHK